jgi:mRNA-decapping enzyme 1B
MTGGGKQPKVDHTQTDSMNLKVLRRDDPSIQTILGSASSIAMYELDMQTTKWHRKNVEGSLFVVERKKSSSNSSNSRFQFIVLNRLSDERFVESIAKDAEFEMSEKYLLYKTDTDEVNGVWFYDEKEQTNIYEIIQRAQEMERRGIYANNGEEGGGGGGGTGTTKSGGSSIDDVASLFQSAMSGFGGGAEKPAKPKPKKETNIAAGKKKSGGVGSSAGESSSGAMITRDAIRNAMLRLATNDQFLDAVASELNR